MYVRNREPSVDDMLSDLVIRLLMERDGLSEEAVRNYISDAKRRLDAADAGERPSAQVEPA
jgi:hypothetical protein